ncbi:MAG TPA: hypothetical protein VK636_03605 [Gemmatimonadaceae bacterium]|nr:hypothetical protein [Gemmatimonadaceae bacterium]
MAIEPSETSSTDETLRTNSSPQPGRFFSSVQTCRDVLARLPVAGPLKALRAPILALARIARQESVAPERFIAELKSVLFHLPQFEARRALERGEMMHQLMSVAINAYYGRQDD